MAILARRSAVEIAGRAAVTRSTSSSEQVHLARDQGRGDAHLAAGEGRSPDERHGTTGRLPEREFRGGGEFVQPREQLRRGEDYSQDTLAALASIRPRLLPRYRAMSDEDLMVQGIVYVARKPGVRAER